MNNAAWTATVRLPLMIYEGVEDRPMVALNPKEVARLVNGEQVEVPALDDKERVLRLNTLGIKRTVFQDLRYSIGAGPDVRIKRKSENKLTSMGEGSEGASWDQPFVYVLVDYPLTEPGTFAPPPELTNNTERAGWISSKLAKEWGTKGTVLSTLETLTRLAAFARMDGDEMTPVVPLAFVDRFQAMDEAERQSFLNGWFSRVSHGDNYREEEEGRAFPESDASVKVESDGRTFTAALVFEVYPLLVDFEGPRTCHARYLIRAGIAWDGDLGSPAGWSENEREALWTAIFASFDRLAETYETGARAPNEVEVIVDGDTYSVSGGAPDWKPTTGILPDASPLNEKRVSREEALLTFGGGDGRTFTTGRRTFPLAFGPAMVDAYAVSVIQQTHKIKLPRAWSKLKRWADIEREHIAGYLEQGPEAFEDLRASSGDASLYPRLRHFYGRAGKKEPVTKLSVEEERRLRLTYGDTGFLDTDSKGREALYRCIQDSEGHVLEFWLSWHDRASPFFGDQIDKAKEKILAEWPKEDATQPALFADLDGDVKRRLNRELERLKVYEHGRSVMEAILGQVYVQRQNPVEVPAEAFRVLLWPSGDYPQDWKQTVERTLGALRAMTISYKAGSNHHGEHSFLAGWDYLAKGRGGHGDGIFVAHVNSVFTGCFKAFERAGATKSRSGFDAIVFDFTKTLEPKEQKSLSYVRFDAGAAFYHAAAGLTAEQQNLIRFIEHKITKRRDPARFIRSKERLSSKNPKANDDRLYDASFCPLIPEGSQFVAALGNHRRAPEVGFTLYGTDTKATTTGGGHVGGLVAVLGYPLPPGRAHRGRMDIVRKSLEDLKAVVVDYLGGIIIGRLNERERADKGTGEAWLSLHEIGQLDERTLCRKVKFMLFLPPDWNERRREVFERKHNVRVTESVAEAQAAAWGTASPNITEAVAEHQAEATAEPVERTDTWDGYPLPHRLHVALKERNLRRTDLARIFGVTKGAVSHWLHGMKDGEDPAKAKRIPEDLAVLMVRWLDAGIEPTAEELAALPSRNRTPRARSA